MPSELDVHGAPPRTVLIDGTMSVNKKSGSRADKSFFTFTPSLGLFRTMPRPVIFSAHVELFIVAAALLIHVARVQHVVVEPRYNSLWKPGSPG